MEKDEVHGKIIYCAIVQTLILGLEGLDILGATLLSPFRRLWQESIKIIKKKQVCQGIFGVVTVKALGGKRFWQQVGYGQWTNRETFSKVIHFKRLSLLRDQQQQEGRRLQRWKAWGEEVRRVGELRRESKKSWRTHERK